MKRLEKKGLACILLAVVVGGCGDKFWDPAQIGRFRPTPAVNVILDSLGVAEESPVAWDQAAEPRPNDIVAIPTDYALRSGDIVRISIYELFQSGVAVINDYIVTETGKISIPDVGVVQAAGLTETQLEDEIRQILSPSILKEPMVTVLLINSQQRAYSVLGDGVANPGRYVIPRYDFRLTDALATAGGSRQFNVSYIYVSRSLEGKGGAGEQTGPEIKEPEIRELKTVEPEGLEGESRRDVPLRRNGEFGAGAGNVPEPKEPAGRYRSEQEMLDVAVPYAQRQWPATDKVVVSSSEMTGYRSRSHEYLPKGFQPVAPGIQANAYARQVVQSPAELGDSEPVSSPEDATNRQGSRVEWIFQDGKWIPVQINGAEFANDSVAGENRNTGIEWTFRDGKWIPVQTQPGALERPATKLEPKGPAVPLEDEKVLPMELEWSQAVQTRLIKIPAAKLLAGDPRYNIVIKPGDTIHVPVDIIGEFCIMGNVNNSGYVNITGRPMTLKMAIAAAGGLGQLAWPKNCEVVRRIGERKEEIVMVDLDKIANGEQPDFLIKPNDLINVGTHPTSRWRAILRNAFRAAYGFGFVYDRNFAYADYYYGSSLF